MVSGGRRVAARVVAVVLALFWAVLWFGLIDLSVVVEQDERFHEHYLFESGWGLLYTLLVAVPIVVLAVRPGHRVALTQLGVVTLAVLAGAAWRGSWPQLTNALGLAVTVVVLAALGRGGPTHGRRPDLPLAVLALVALPAALVYAAPLVGNTTAEEDITNGVSHYPMQASLALAVVALVALAAVTRARLPAWTAAATTVWLGVESVVYPTLPGSLGTRGGTGAAAWALLVVVSLERARRREPGLRAPTSAVATSSG